METFWTVGIVGLFVLNAVFLLLLLTFAREMGVILVRMGPGHAKQLLSGPRIGEELSPFQVDDVAGETHYVGATKADDYLLLFIAPGCPSCKNLLPAMKTLANTYERTKTLIISSGNNTPEDTMHAAMLRRKVPYICNSDLHAEYQVDATPYAVLLDNDLKVKNKGIVNNLEHLESLYSLEIRTLGGLAEDDRPEMRAVEAEGINLHVHAPKQHARQ